MASNPIPILLTIFTLVWLLVLGGTIIIFQFIVPLVIFHSFMDGVTKGILVVILVVVWVDLFMLMRNAMENRQLRPRKIQG
ncbi:MAG: hypothetical protein ABSE82_07780 [Nitrososphaerales archaeon]